MVSRWSAGSGRQSEVQRDDQDGPEETHHSNRIAASSWKCSLGKVVNPSLRRSSTPAEEYVQVSISRVSKERSEKLRNAVTKVASLCSVRTFLLLVQELHVQPFRRDDLALLPLLQHLGQPERNL